MLSCFTISKRKQPLHQATPERLCQSSVFVVKKQKGFKTRTGVLCDFFNLFKNKACKGKEGELVNLSEPPSHKHKASELPLPETFSSSLKIGQNFPSRKVVFQPSIFQG